MKKSPAGNTPLVLTACFLLPLITMSILWLRHPDKVQASSTQVVLASHQTPVLPATSGDGDTEEDELLEHWDNPIYSHEERLQLVGFVPFFVGVGILSARRRASLRRFYRAN